MKVKKNGRGFSFVEFEDYSGIKCSIQKSSLATKDCIWLGANEIGLKQFIPNGNPSWIDRPEFDSGDFIGNNRMQLTRKHIEKLLPILQRFVETGEIYEPVKL